MLVNNFWRSDNWWRKSFFFSYSWDSADVQADLSTRWCVWPFSGPSRWCESVQEGVFRRGRQHGMLCHGGLGDVQHVSEETGHHSVCLWIIEWPGLKRTIMNEFQPPNETTFFILWNWRGPAPFTCHSYKFGFPLLISWGNNVCVVFLLILL